MKNKKISDPYIEEVEDPINIRIIIPDSYIFFHEVGTPTSKKNQYMI